LPEPVGAAISVCWPALIAGHAFACAGVGEAKQSANQVATAGWKRSETFMVLMKGDHRTEVNLIDESFY
jgi:hypothetical protein